MHEHGLARDLWPQLQVIARDKGLSSVTRLDLTVGMLHGASADFLAHSFEHVFEGSSFEGTVVNIEIVEPGQSFSLEGADSAQIATGWELLITRMDGSER